MPSKTIYISDELYIELIKEENPSKLIQALLREYYAKRKAEAKSPEPEKSA